MMNNKKTKMNKKVNISPKIKYMVRKWASKFEREKETMKNNDFRDYLTK